MTASIVGGGTLEGTTNATVSGGIATFTNLSDQKAGAITLAFKSGSLAAATSGPVVVSPAAASQLVIHVVQSSTATAGQPFAIQPVIEEEDSFGNLEQGDNSTVVTATLNTGSGPLAGTTTATVSGGVATFTGLFDDKAETITLAFKSGGLTQAISGPVVISPAAASQLVVRVGQSSTATAGSPFNIQPVILEEDQFGNLEQSDNSTIVTAARAGAGPLEGTTELAVTGGVAAFTGLSDNKAETLTLEFSSGSLTPASTGQTVMNPAAASQLVLASQVSSTAIAGQPLSVEPVIEEEDPFGNLETGDNSTLVTASVEGGGPLEGSNNVTVSAAWRPSPALPMTRPKP